MSNAGQRPLPHGWRWVRLGEVCEFLDSRRVPVNETERVKRTAGKKQSDLSPYYGANGQVGWIDGYLFDEPLILLAEDGGNFGSQDRPIAYEVFGRYWVNNHAHVLRPHDAIDFSYCLHALRLRADVGDLVSGSTRAKLNQEIASNIPVPLPPLAEQRRIASILSEQMAAAERAQAAAEARSEAAKALPAAYLRAVFSSPEARQWPRRRLGEVCGINPRRPDLQRAEDAPTTFVPMSAVEEAGRGVARAEHKPFCEVRKGYTYFGEGDILFAKITPCMQNAKHAIARHLIDGIGFGSTEFHILRPKNEIISEWVHQFLLQPRVLQEATAHFTGAVGQRRVPPNYLAGLGIPLPPLAEQQRIAAILNEQMAAVDRLRKALDEELDMASKLPAALLRRAFSGEL